ncbi:HAD family hydrolase [Psychromonas sp. KJ10-10]|uniref:HAD family hydrolase n=1 Tax=Psychromonas sp. KJ10-10 TaxID=3391823 RepID=UPI0039B39F6F
MIKLIALDMDGTLLNDQKCISKGNFQAIQADEKRGYQSSASLRKTTSRFITSFTKPRFNQ